MTDTDKLYKIKPLEWVGVGRSVEQAFTPFGFYAVEKNLLVYYFGEQLGASDSDFFPCTSIEEGKAAAEAHWRERILPMLEEVE